MPISVIDNTDGGLATLYSVIDNTEGDLRAHISGIDNTDGKSLPPPRSSQH